MASKTSFAGSVVITYEEQDEVLIWNIEMWCA